MATSSDKEATALSAGGLCTPAKSNKSDPGTIGKAQGHYELTEGAVQEALNAVENAAPGQPLVKPQAALSSEVSLGTVTTTLSRERKPSRKSSEGVAAAAAAARFKPSKDKPSRPSTGSSEAGPAILQTSNKRVMPPMVAESNGSANPSTKLKRKSPDLTADGQPKASRRPTNNQLLYRAQFRWKHYPWAQAPETAHLYENMPQATDACPSVTSAFLQVLKTVHTAETLRGAERHSLNWLSQNTRRSKVIKLDSPGRQKLGEKLKEDARKHSISDDEGNSYTTNLDRNRYGNDDNYLATVIRQDLQMLQLNTAFVEVEIIDAKSGHTTVVSSDGKPNPRLDRAPTHNYKQCPPGLIKPKARTPGLKRFGGPDTATRRGLAMFLAQADGDCGTNGHTANSKLGMLLDALAAHKEEPDVDDRKRKADSPTGKTAKAARANSTPSGDIIRPGSPHTESSSGTDVCLEAHETLGNIPPHLPEPGPTPTAFMTPTGAGCDRGASPRSGATPSRYEGADQLHQRRYAYISPPSEDEQHSRLEMRNKDLQTQVHELAKRLSEERALNQRTMESLHQLQAASTAQTKLLQERCNNLEAQVQQLVAEIATSVRFAHDNESEEDGPAQQNQSAQGAAKQPAADPSDHAIHGELERLRVDLSRAESRADALKVQNAIACGSLVGLYKSLAEKGIPPEMHARIHTALVSAGVHEVQSLGVPYVPQMTFCESPMNRKGPHEGVTPCVPAIATQSSLSSEVDADSRKTIAPHAPTVGTPKANAADLTKQHGAGRAHITTDTRAPKIKEDVDHAMPSAQKAGPTAQSQSPLSPVLGPQSPAPNMPLQSMASPVC